MKLTLFFFCALFLVSCKKPDRLVVRPKGEFFGIEPKSKPQILAPNFINTNMIEYNGTFSPNGDEFYYTTEFNNKGYITYTKMNSDKSWTNPKIASFSGNYSDYDPLFSPNGSRIYFSSTRPIEKNLGSSIWYVEKQDGHWSEPEYIDFTKKNEFYSSITNDGTIYFNIWSTNNIYKAVPNEDRYTIIELDTILNGDYEKGDPFISPTEDYMIFRAIREDGFGRGDLYISYHLKNQWTKPINLGEKINSFGQEMCPYVTADGKVFIFASSDAKEQNHHPESSITSLLVESNSILNGKMNIYFSSTEFIEELRKKVTMDSNCLERTAVRTKTFKTINSQTISLIKYDK